MNFLLSKLYIIYVLTKIILSSFSMDIIVEKEHPRWTKMWESGISIGQAFDTGHVSPLLDKYIKEGKIPNGKALVPGCGRGYDVTALSGRDRKVLGSDISEIAIQSAKARMENLSDDDCYKENIVFTTDSFFSLDDSQEENLFDFIYDYTFLCALNPSVREEWAKKMSSLLKTNGELLTLIFPIIEGEYESGPPYKVSLDLLSDLLLPVGFECLELSLLPSELCHSGRDGSGAMSAKSGIGRWKKKN